MRKYIASNSLKYQLQGLVLVILTLASAYLNFKLIPLLILWILMVVIDTCYNYRQFQKLAHSCQQITTIHKQIDDTSALAELITLTVKRLTDEYYLELKQLEQADNEYTEFIELWTHEIKLAISNLRNLCEANYDPVIFSEIENVEASIARMLGLSSSAQNLVNQNFLQLELQTICNAAIKQEMNSLINSKIKVEIISDDSQIISDKYWITFIVRQLINNSVKYGAHHIKLTIRDNILQITDDGIGIDSLEEELIFNKFYCSNRSKESVKSTGIGLYLVRSIAIKYGYRVRAKAESTGLTIEIDFTNH